MFVYFQPRTYVLREYTQKVSYFLCVSIRHKSGQWTQEWFYQYKYLTMPLRNIEIELKFPLYNPDEIKNELNNIAKVGKVNDYQKDIYYVPAHKNFFEEKPVTKWLRLRESQKWYSLDFKHYHSTATNTSSVCDEFVVKLDNLESFKEIFKRLDFKELIVVDKTRNTRIYKDVEIAIDEVKDLWIFIELEASGEFEDEESATKHLHEIANELQLKIWAQDFKGYPYLILEKNIVD